MEEDEKTAENRLTYSNVRFPLKKRWVLDYEIDALIADMMDADLKEQGA